MAPAFPIGSMVVYEKSDTGVKRGDAIAFEFTDSKTQFISRVAAVKGDRIENTPAGLKINRKTQPEKTGTYQSKTTKSVIRIQYPAFGETLLLGDGDFYVLADNFENGLDSRHMGLVRAEKIKGKAYLWSDVLKVNGWPNVFLMRSVSNIKPLLPIEFEDGVLLENVVVHGDKSIRSYLRMQKPIGQESQNAFFQRSINGRRQVYCRSSTGVDLFGVSAAYVILDSNGESQMEFEFTPESCLERKD